MVEDLTDQMKQLGFEGLRPAHSAVFENIGLNTRGTRLVDLASRAQMTPQSMSELIINLETLGYVERIPDPDDGRARRIRLTGRGHEAGKAAMQVMRTIDSRWIEALGFPPGRLLHIALQHAHAVDDSRRAELQRSEKEASSPLLT
jgi:DNA-binding MarR family transcriptional regulator